MDHILPYIASNIVENTSFLYIIRCGCFSHWKRADKYNCYVEKCVDVCFAAGSVWESWIIHYSRRRVVGIMRSSAPVCVCVSVCPHDRTKTGETTITKFVFQAMEWLAWVCTLFKSIAPCRLRELWFFVRIGPIRFLAGYRKRRLNQG